jgi:WD40 repeat protein
MLAKGALERLIVGHQGAVSSVVWAGAGAMLVSGGADKSVRQWNVADGAQQRIYQGHADAVTSVVVSHDGVTIFAAGVDKTLRAWPLADPAKQHYAIATPTPVRSLRLAGDSTRVYAASDDNDIRAFDAVTGRLIEQTPLPGVSSALFLAADGNNLLSIGADNGIRRAPFRCAKLAAADAVKAHELAALANDDGVAVSCEDKTIKLFDARGTLLRPLAAPPVPVTHIGVAADGLTLAAAGDAGGTQPNVWAWNPSDARHLFTLVQPANVASLAMSPEGRIAVSLADRRVLIYEQGQLLEETTLPAVATRLLYLNATTIAALIGDQHVHILKPSCELRFTGQQGAMGASAVSPDGKLFTGGAEAVLRVWDTTTGKQVSAATLAAGALQVRLSAKGEFVVASCADGKLLRWDAAAFKKEQADPPAGTIQLPIGSRGLSLSADGQQAVVGGDDGWLRTFALTSGKELEKHGPSAAGVLAAAWSPESGRVFSSSADKIFTRSQLGLAAAHALSKESLQTLAQTADGSRVAVADASGRIVVVTTADGKVVFEQQLASKVIHRLAWSSDGKELAAATGDGALVIQVK